MYMRTENRTPLNSDEFNLNNPFTKSLVKDRLYRQLGDTCPGCFRRFKLEDLTIDHIEPESEGGADDLHNLQLLCQPCNSTKGNRSMRYLAQRNREKGIILPNQYIRIICQYPPKKNPITDIHVVENPFVF